jgi:hypothetical protein
VLCLTSTRRACVSGVMHERRNGIRCPLTERITLGLGQVRGTFSYDVLESDKPGQLLIRELHTLIVGFKTLISSKLQLLQRSLKKLRGL